MAHKMVYTTNWRKGMISQTWIQYLFYFMTFQIYGRTSIFWFVINSYTWETHDSCSRFTDVTTKSQRSVSFIVIYLENNRAKPNQVFSLQSPYSFYYTKVNPKATWLGLLWQELQMQLVTVTSHHPQQETDIVRPQYKVSRVYGSECCKGVYLFTSLLSLPPKKGKGT